MKVKHLLVTGFVLVFQTFYIEAQVNKPSSVPDRVVLNLTENPATSVAITWRTDNSAIENFCELQKSTDGPVKNEESNRYKAKTTEIAYTYNDEPRIEANQHAVIITGLVPGEKYIYRVGSGNSWSEWFEFQTAESDEKFSFIYFGDPQTDLKSQWSRVIRAAYRHAPDCGFMLYAGDLINRAGRDLEWHEWFYAGSFIFGTVPQVMTPGNHDYDDLTLDSHWNAQFTQPSNGPKGVEGTCFVIDYKNLRLVSIDSAADSELENENGYAMQAQKAWLDSVLQSNTKDWVVVTTHLPFYSPKENRDNKLLRENFQPILEKHKVDLVLTGHDHSYGRGRYSDNSQAGHKVIYVVSVSGPKMYEAGDKDWMEHSGAQKQLYQIISIDGNELVYESFTARGDLFDRFVLKKRKNGKLKFTENRFL